MSEDIVKVHRACLHAVTEPARAVLEAYRAQVGDAEVRMHGEVIVTLQVRMKIATLRNLAAHLAHDH